MLPGNAHIDLVDLHVRGNGRLFHGTPDGFRRAFYIDDRTSHHTGGFGFPVSQNLDFSGYQIALPYHGNHFGRTDVKPYNHLHIIVGESPEFRVFCHIL